MADYTGLIDFDTCSKLEFIRYLTTVEGMSMALALEAWAITREGAADVVVDGTFYRPDLEEPTARES